MGTDWNPNQALPIDLLKVILEWYDTKMQEANTALELSRQIVTHTYIAVAYVLSLRDPEGFLLDLDGLKILDKKMSMGSISLSV